MSHNIFGWSLPAGCSTLPGEEDYNSNCSACGKHEDDFPTDWDDVACTDKGGYVFCSPACLERGPVDPDEEDHVDWDNAYKVSLWNDEEIDQCDTVYFKVYQRHDGWYLTADLDCDTGGFTESLCKADGSYPTKDDALGAGVSQALDWAADNDRLHFEIDSTLHRIPWIGRLVAAQKETL